MNRVVFIAFLFLLSSTIGCHRGLRNGGLMGLRYQQMPGGCNSCDAGGVHYSGAGMGTGGCSRCNGEPARFRDSAGSPILSRIAQGLTCGSGCGEVYWGEWISTPPKPDPCDSCGNYTGVPNSKMYRPHRQPVRRLVNAVKGVRYGSPCQSCGSSDPCGCDSGCGDCGSTTASDCGCGSGHAVPVPKVQKQPSKVIPDPQPRADQPIQKTSYHQPVAKSGCKTCSH